MENVVTKIQRKSSSINKANKKKASRAKTKRRQKAAKRKIRRKHNKIKYYEALKRVRYRRSTEDLCSAVEVVEINDMDWKTTQFSSHLPVEIVDWHKQEQIAYWKSRAVSLELENRMLKQHLRNVYAQTIVDSLNLEESANEEPVAECSNKKKDKIIKEVIPNLPKPEFKNRMEEMRKIYGDRAEKLICMETGIQLNYERTLEEHKPAFWPTLPLNL